MSIKREDVDTGRIDFAEVITGKKLPPIHPGEILRDEFLHPIKISVYTLVQAIVNGCQNPRIDGAATWWTHRRSRGHLPGSDRQRGFCVGFTAQKPV